jgi:hypothetical protein
MLNLLDLEYFILFVFHFNFLFFPTPNSLKGWNQIFIRFELPIIFYSEKQRKCRTLKEIPVRHFGTANTYLRPNNFPFIHPSISIIFSPSFSSFLFLNYIEDIVKEKREIVFKEELLNEHRVSLNLRDPSQGYFLAIPFATLFSPSITMDCIYFIQIHALVLKSLCMQRKPKS